MLQTLSLGFQDKINMHTQICNSSTVYVFIINCSLSPSPYTYIDIHVYLFIHVKDGFVLDGYLWVCPIFVGYSPHAALSTCLSVNRITYICRWWSCIARQ